MGSLNIDITPLDALPQSARVVLEGAIDASSVSGFEAQLKQLQQDGFSKFVLDMAGIKYVNSTGLGSLVTTADMLERVEGGLALIRVHPKVRVVFDMLGLNSFFRIFDTEAEAIEYFATGSVKPQQQELKLPVRVQTGKLPQQQPQPAAASPVTDVFAPPPAPPPPPQAPYYPPQAYGQQPAYNVPSGHYPQQGVPHSPPAMPGVHYPPSQRQTMPSPSYQPGTGFYAPVGNAYPGSNMYPSQAPSPQGYAAPGYAPHGASPYGAPQPEYVPPSPANPQVVACFVCGANFRITQVGRYKCPSCSAPFVVDPVYGLEIAPATSQLTLSFTPECREGLALFLNAMVRRAGYTDNEFFHLKSALDDILDRILDRQHQGRMFETFSIAFFPARNNLQVKLVSGGEPMRGDARAWFPNAAAIFSQIELRDHPQGQGTVIIAALRRQLPAAGGRA